MQTSPQTQPETLNLQSDTVGELVMSMMGVDRFAYIKPNGASLFTVYAADGTELADFDSHEDAMEAITRHHLTPVRVH